MDIRDFDIDDYNRRFPFEKLPGEPPPHKIMGELADGTKVNAGAVEMVWNDRHFINFVKGAGSYEAAADPRELEVLAMAKLLYGKEN